MVIWVEANQMSLGDKINAVIAACSVILAFIAIWQASIARSAMRRQLRAYLSVTPQQVSNFVIGERVQIHCIVKNHGLTPAFSISHVFEIDIRPVGSAIEMEYPNPRQKIPSDSTLFPGDMKTWMNCPSSLSEADFKSVGSGSASIYVWGKTTYKDAFGRTRTTEFNAHVADPSAMARGALAILSGAPAVEWMWVWGPSHGFAT